MIVLTESDDPSLTLELMRQGAAACLPAPFDFSRLAFLIDILSVRSRHRPRKSADNSPHRENGVVWLDRYAVRRAWTCWSANCRPSPPRRPRSS